MYARIGRTSFLLQYFFLGPTIKLQQWSIKTREEVFFLLHTGDNPSTISVKFIRKNGFSSISSIPTAEMKGKVPRVLLKITCDTHTNTITWVLKEKKSLQFSNESIYL